MLHDDSAINLLQMFSYKFFSP